MKKPEFFHFRARNFARFASGPFRERSVFEAAAFSIEGYPEGDLYLPGRTEVFAVMSTHKDLPRFLVRVRRDETEKHRNGIGTWSLEHRVPGVGWEELASGPDGVDTAGAVRLAISLVCAIPGLTPFDPEPPALTE